MQVLVATTGGQTTHYVPGLAQHDVNGWHYFAGDRLGSVRLMVGADEELHLAQSFDPFGNQLERLGSGQSAFGYTGEQVDPTGFVYLRARYYDPRVGRFLTPDSIVPDPLSSRGWNRYAYVGNNPVRYSDPSGHCPSCVPATPLLGAGPPGWVLYGLLGVATTAAVIIAMDQAPPLQLPGFSTIPRDIFEPTSGGMTLSDQSINVCYQPGADLGLPAQFPFGTPPFSLGGPDPGLNIFEPAGPGIEVPNVYQATHKHHIFPQQFRDWFAEKGIDVDDYTVAIDSKVHLRGIHGRGLGDLPGRWNVRWAQFILANPEATSTEVGQFAAELMQEFNLDDLPIEPYR